MKKRVIALALGCTVAFGCAVGGTLAWLTDSTDAVTNTFTASDIEITLDETAPDGKTAKMVPGDTFAKDPKVTVEKGSEACWLFVSVTESDNLDDFISYEVADDWKKLDNYENIYYREVTADYINGDSNNGFYILKGNSTYLNGYVTVKDSVKKSDMEGIKSSGQPTLTFNACAVQSAHLETLDKAWEQADADFKELAVATTSTN